MEKWDKKDKNKSKYLVRVYVDIDTHRRVKSFAGRENISLQEAYKKIVDTVLDEEGKLRTLIEVEEIPRYISLSDQNERI